MIQDIAIPDILKTSFGSSHFAAEQVRLFAIKEFIDKKRKIDTLESANEELQQSNKRLRLELNQLVMQQVTNNVGETKEGKEESKDEDWDESDEEDDENEGEGPRIKGKKVTKPVEIGAFGYRKRGRTCTLMMPFTEVLHSGVYNGKPIRFFGEKNAPWCLLRDLSENLQVQQKYRSAMLKDFKTPDDKAKIIFKVTKTDEFLILSEAGVKKVFAREKFRDEQDLYKWYLEEIKKIKNS